MSTLKAITQKLQWLNKRSSLISQNLAHKGVAGYKAKDLKEFKFQDELNKSKNTHKDSLSGSKTTGVTDSKHIPLNVAGGSVGAKSVIDKNGFMTITGNSVNSDEELQKLNDTSTEYVKMINIYKKNIDWIKSALGKR